MHFHYSIQLKSILFFLMLFVIAVPSRAQQASFQQISGAILDAETNEPLAGVHVFLASRLQGSTTDKDGRFVLESVLPGSYKVVASIIGYDSDFVLIDVLPDQPPTNVAIRLKPTVYELEGVTVVEEEPKEWKKQLARFEDMFLGTSSNAKETQIVNDYVLSFREADGIFEAFASEPLEIENHGLGYNLTFILDQFRHDKEEALKYTLGTWRFEEMETANRKLITKWEKQREYVFKGSLQHLLWSMVHLKTEEEGFYLLRDSTDQSPYPETFLTKYYPLDERTILRRTKKHYEFKMAFRDYIRIYYERKGDRVKLFSKEKPPPAEQLSYMKMNRLGEATIHESGYLYSPAGVSSAVTVYGFLASRGVADLLPQEYSLQRRFE